jgi:hypothetical protein
MAPKGSFESSFSLISLSLGWCLPTGFETPIPYFYVLYFVVLLVHRQIRDDEACKAKYGKDWDKVGWLPRVEAGVSDGLVIQVITMWLHDLARC